MKGLSRIPQTQDLAAAYALLQSDTGIGVEELVLWTQWSRFDPRLAEQWISYLCRNWKAIAPLEFREKIRLQPWPSAAGVLLTQIIEERLLAPEERRVFRHWAGMVMEGTTPASNEQFFIGLRAFGGKQMREDAEKSLRSYVKWGYLGRETLVNKAKPYARTRVNPVIRNRALKELMNSRERFTVRDYQNAVGGQLSARQAQLDLSKERNLIAIGNTRGRSYRVKRGR